MKVAIHEDGKLIQCKECYNIQERRFGNHKNPKIDKTNLDFHVWWLRYMEIPGVTSS